MANKLVKQSTDNAWNAGGVSAIAKAGDLVAQFTLVAGSAGIIAGLAPPLSNPSYASVEHGFLARSGSPAQIIESGVVVASIGAAFVSDIVVNIYRVGTTVYYTTGDFAHTSTTPSTGNKSIQAVLYAKGDAVNDPSVEAYSVDIENAGMSGSFTLTDGCGFERIFYADFSGSIGLSSESEGSVFIVASTESFLVLVDGLGASVIVVAGMSGTINLSGAAGAESLELLQYATNLVSGAVTRYSGFDFDGFCRVGMDTYGFKHDGLYRIDGASDSGLPINALIEFQADDFGSPQGKRAGNIFLGLDTDGNVLVRTIEDSGREMNYRAYQRRSEFRADMARGRASRFWSLRLEISDSSHAQLDNIEWVVSTNGRRT